MSPVWLVLAGVFGLLWARNWRDSNDPTSEELAERLCEKDYMTAPDRAQCRASLDKFYAAWLAEPQPKDKTLQELISMCKDFGGSADECLDFAFDMVDYCEARKAGR